MKALKFFAVSLFILASGAAFAQTRPVAKSVSAEALKDKQIKLSWEFPAKTEPKISSVQIFRRMRPYAQTEDLEGDLPVAELPVTEKSHIDALTEPGSWFYAVVAVTKNGPYKIIIPGMNATVKGVRPKAAPAPEEPASAKSEGKAQEDRNRACRQDGHGNRRKADREYDRRIRRRFLWQNAWRKHRGAAWQKHSGHALQGMILSPHRTGGIISSCHRRQNVI